MSLQYKAGEINAAKWRVSVSRDTSYALRDHSSHHGGQYEQLRPRVHDAMQVSAKLHGFGPHKPEVRREMKIVVP
jgi:hypothetical protein